MIVIIFNVILLFSGVGLCLKKKISFDFCVFLYIVDDVKIYVRVILEYFVFLVEFLVWFIVVVLEDGRDY